MIEFGLLHRAFESCGDELEKIALLKTELQPQQQRVVDRIKDPKQPGLVVAHGLGSGKTLTSIAAQEALGTPSTVVVPAALQENYAKERKKHLKGQSQHANIVSMQNIARKGTAPSDPLMIVDEAHRAREGGTKTQKVLANNEAEKRLLLTGSPFYNHPADISPLVNMAAGERVLPATRADFSKRYISEQKVRPGFFDRLRGVRPGMKEVLNPKHRKELGDTFQKWVDYYPGSPENFPSVERENINVPMTKEQLEVYDTMMHKAPPWVAMKIKSRLPPNKQESKQLNAFLSATRQVSNSTAPFTTEPDAEAHDPKIDLAFQKLKEQFDTNPRAKGVVYSNYLGAGLSPYKERLEQAGIPYGEFTGEMNKAKRDDLVHQYNEGKIRALLLSSAGGEGLDLKGTRLMQILEPHWNSEKLKQVEGRGIRYKSHEDLPPEERNVRVQNFLATRPRSGILERLHLKKPGGSVDEYLTQMSSDKERLINEFKTLMAQRQAMTEQQMAQR